METRRVSIGQGLFALRYESSTAPVAPKVVVNVLDNLGLMLLAAPGCGDTWLERPGDCLVIRAERPTEFQVTVTAQGRGASLDATLQLERIVGTSARLVGPPARRSNGLEIMAHLARRGDVAVPAGDWVGGPIAPVRIEGIAIDWPDRPTDVDLRYTVLGRGRTRRRWTDCQAGQFAGSRGESAPLLGLEIALTGLGAARHALVGEALFLGSHVISETGPILRFSGPTGHEPLVGLRLSLAAGQAATSSVRAPLDAGHQLTGRVRAFRRAAAPAA